MKLGVSLAEDRFIILDPIDSGLLMGILNKCRTVYSRVGEGDGATFFTTIDRPHVFVIRDEQVMTMSESQYEAMKEEQP